MWIDSMQRAVDYMEKHLLEGLRIEDIAKEAHMSVYHFQHLFRILTDTSVMDYCRRRRMTLAAGELMAGRRKVLDLAYKYGYDSPESFSKAFRKQHGMSPRDARNYNGSLVFYNRLVIQVSLKGVEPMRYQIMEKEAIRIMGRKERISCKEGENLKIIPQMWRQFNEDGVLDDLDDWNDGVMEGLIGVCCTIGNGESIDYWIGASYQGKQPDGSYDMLEIPASKWAVFEVHGSMPGAIQKVWKQIYSEWFPSSGFTQGNGPEMEVYPDGDPSSDSYYSEIWIPVK
ncbi:AraC family transcriptional regulator [Halobacillus sp. ACCC02827]|uniref:AraC family transcriptional regulator n=1 Tax=unclassified Halobacillus TaxID=2636472 RepID=UPI0002A501E3|nr:MULTISPECIES: AraC family transcriptional regulator [unclassified Halobacillus]ELK44942.1 AraC family transcription regulator [Halobacillus sp. BAB-2008]WJE14257.1 AraC family transcriptional regulator [Halobacillus sp. ACCC02827]